MKRIIVLSIMLALGFTGTSSWAQDRAVNPGEDPNEAKTTKAYEADVAAPGYCPECIARMKHNRIKDDTTYRGAGQGTPENTEATKKGTQ